MKTGYVYILSNKNRTILYIGVTNNLERRMLEHKTGVGATFTTKYQLTDLIYFEDCGNIESAIAREKQLKNWHSDWKWNLIKEENPDLIDLAGEWFSEGDVKEFLENYDGEF